METNGSSGGVDRGGKGAPEETDSVNCSTLTVVTTTAELQPMSTPVEDKCIVVEETGGGGNSEETRGGVNSEEAGEVGNLEETGEVGNSEEAGEGGNSEETGERGNSEEIPCVCAICCCSVEKVPLTEEDDTVFLWFLKWFRFEPLSSIRRGLHDKRNGGWKDTVGESLRFCEPCKVEVVWIKDILKKFKCPARIKKEKKIAMNKVRMKMRECEGIFEEKKIYEKDNRYYLLRIKAFKVPTVFVGYNGYRPRKKKEEICSEKKTEEVDGEEEKVDEVEEEDTPKMRISRRLKKPVTYYVPEVTGRKRKIENQVGIGEEVEKEEEGKNKEVEVNKEESEVQVKLEEFPVEYEEEEMGGMDNFWFGEDCEIDKKEGLLSGNLQTEMESQPTKRAKKNVKKKASKRNRRPGPLSKVGARTEVKKVAPSSRPIRRKGKSLRSHSTRNMKEPAKTLNENPDKAHQQNCLFCYKALSPEDIRLKLVLTSDLVEANFHSLFILKKMLNIPKSKITDYLENFPDPRNWIQFCRQCLSVVDEALMIQKRIEELEVKLRKLQNGMVDKINSTFKNDYSHGHQKKRRRRVSDSGNISRITEETRQFIYSNSTTPPPVKVNRAIPQKAAASVPFVAPAPPPRQPPSLTVACTLGAIPEETFIAVLEEPCVPNLNSDDNNDNDDFNEDEPPLSPSLSPSPPSPPNQFQDAPEENLKDILDEDSSCDANDYIDDAADDPDYNIDEYIPPLSPSSLPPLSPPPSSSVVPLSFSRKRRSTRTRASFKRQAAGEVLNKICSVESQSVSPAENQPLDPRMYMCSLCPALQPMPFGKLYTHGIFHFKRPFKCSECNSHWSGSTEEIEKNPFKTTTTKTKNRRIKHICSMETLVKTPAFHSDNFWKCNWCLETFAMDSERDSHEAECPSSKKDQTDNIQQELKFECLSCPEEAENKKCYRNQEELLLHRVLKHVSTVDAEETKYPELGACDFCGLVILKQYINRHMKRKHSNGLATAVVMKRKKKSVIKRVVKVKPKQTDSEEKYDEFLGKGEYKCSLCPSEEEPMSFVKFYSHVMFHYRRPFKCSECNLYWSGTNELEKNPFAGKCGNAQGHLCSKETLKEMPGLQPGNIWKCSGCPEAFSKEIERDSHEQEKCPNKSEISFEGKYKCLSCSDDKKGYRSYEEWLLHRVLEHTEKAITSCLFCDESSAIKTKDGLDYFDIAVMHKHVFSEHKFSGFKGMYLDTCDFCGVTCKSCQELKRHVQKIHGLNESDAFSCRSCHYRSSLPDYVKKHVMRRHAVQKKKVEYQVCDICGMSIYMSGRPFALVNHKLLKHEIEPPEEDELKMKIKRCEVEGCGFRSLYLGSFKVHMMKIHGAERKHKCEVCGKGFLGSGKLAEHLKIHRNKETKPYQCEICGNSFALRNYLYIHMRLTHLNRPFASTHKKKPYRRRPTGRGMDRGTGGGDLLEGPESSQTLNYLQPTPTPALPQALSQGAPVPCTSTAGNAFMEGATLFNFNLI